MSPAPPVSKPAQSGGWLSLIALFEQFRLADKVVQITWASLDPKKLSFLL
jgi:hypothetical protein